MACVACEALGGCYGDSFDFIQEIKEENPKLDSDNYQEAAEAWLKYCEDVYPWIFKDDYQPTFSDVDEEPYMIDALMDLLDRAGHPPFAPVPDWIPTKLARAIQRMAKADALASDSVIRKFVHDRISPKEEWLIADTDFTHITALGMTSKQMAILVEQVFNPMFLNDRPDLLASLHTCQ